MGKILILADDMTGANDTGAAISELGYRVFSVSDPEGSIDEMEECDCLSVNLDSRSMPKEKAYRRVQQSLERFAKPDTRIFSKRIDSTLRGNLGSECDALLDWMGKGAVCFVVPAFPHAGRTFHDGCVYVYDTILTQTAAAKDPKCPVHSDSPEQIFREQSDRPMATVPLAEVRGDALAAIIEELYTKGNEILIFEAVTQEDIAAIAKAAAKCPHLFACCDPGSFTGAMVRECMESAENAAATEYQPAGSDVLAVVGSVNQVSCEQVKVLQSKPGTGTVVFDVAEFLTGDPEKAVGQAISGITSQPDTAKTVLLVLSCTMEEPEKRLRFDAIAQAENTTIEAVCERVNAGIARVAHSCLSASGRFGAVFSCGGDISSALFRIMKVNCMEVLEEVIPLAVCARLKNGMIITTKGGMIGDPNAMCTCIEHMKTKCLKAE